jgi:putative SOS response-associated peptidase YedK
MCGRYTVQVDMVEVHRRFKVALDELYQKNYNCAPTENLPVITNKSPEKLNYFHWGLIPFWAKDRKIGFKMINARAESLMEKTFKNALEKRRCLVVADGFYEWKTEGKTKQPYRIVVKESPLFAFAGLWEYNKDLNISSFTIISTTANELVEPIHDRMPVILRPEFEKKWLDTDIDPMEIQDMLQPYPADHMTAYPVSSAVGNVRNKHPELIMPIED